MHSTTQQRSMRCLRATALEIWYVLLNVDFMVQLLADSNMPSCQRMCRLVKAHHSRSKTLTQTNQNAIRLSLCAPCSPSMQRRLLMSWALHCGRLMSSSMSGTISLSHMSTPRPGRCVSFAAAAVPCKHQLTLARIGFIVCSLSIHLTSLLTLPLIDCSLVFTYDMDHVCFCFRSELRVRA